MCRSLMPKVVPSVSGFVRKGRDKTSLSDELGIAGSSNREVVSN